MNKRSKNDIIMLTFNKEGKAMAKDKVSWGEYHNDKGEIMLNKPHNGGVTIDVLVGDERGDT